MWSLAEKIFKKIPGSFDTRLITLLDKMVCAHSPFRYPQYINNLVWRVRTHESRSTENKTDPK